MNDKMKILIAYEGSDCSKEAIKDLRRAGLPREIAGEDLRAVAGLHVLSELTEGDPKCVLISRAKTFDADCIFVGSRGSNSRLERHTLGSVSAAVANGAHC